MEEGTRRVLVKLARDREKKGIIRGDGNYINRVDDAQCAKIYKSRMDGQGSYKEYDELKGPDNDCIGPSRAELDESVGAFELFRTARASAEVERTTAPRG